METLETLERDFEGPFFPENLHLLGVFLRNVVENMEHMETVVRLMEHANSVRVRSYEGVPLVQTDEWMEEEE
jgi:hypothetical protein